MKVLCTLLKVICTHSAMMPLSVPVRVQMLNYLSIVYLELQNYSAFRTVVCCLAGSDIGEADRKSQNPADPKAVSALTFVLFPLAAPAYHTKTMLCSSCLSTVRFQIPDWQPFLSQPTRRTLQTLKSRCSIIANYSDTVWNKNLCQSSVLKSLVLSKHWFKHKWLCFHNIDIF